MPVKVIIPTPLRQYTGKKDAVEIKAQTVGEALSGLTTQYADLRKHLFNDEGKLRSFVNVYLNDEDIRYLQKEKTALHDNDVISIVPSIAGGGEVFSCQSSVASEQPDSGYSELRARGSLVTATFSVREFSVARSRNDPARKTTW